MRRAWVIALLLTAPAAQAGMHVGLGSAVAKEADALIDKANEADLHNTTGDNAAQTLPVCGSDLPYSLLPTDLNVIAGIVPLGNLNPSGHTFPTDHIYFYMKPLDPANPVGPRMTANLFAPGAVTVTGMATTEYLSASPPFTDYTIYFYGCRDVKSYYAHVQTLDSAFQAEVGPIDEGCSDYSTGGTRVRRCQKNLAVKVAAGTLMGTSGPPHAVSFDFGTYDMRTTVPFVSPQRRFGDNLHTVCPLDYFEGGVKGQMEALLGRFDGAVRRTVAPVCGEIGYDVAGTARGWWYKPGAPNVPDDPHLTLAPDNIDPTKQDIASGTSVPNLQGWWTFAPVTSGFVDRDFAQVTADGHVYCYDTFMDPLGQPAYTGFRILIGMPTAATLQIERDPSSTTCGAGPWSLSGAAVSFER